MGFLIDTCTRRYGRATLTIRRRGGWSELLGAGDLPKSIAAYREGSAGADEVASAFVAVRVEAHSPTFTWETADQARVLALVADCSTTPVFAARKAQDVADQLLAFQDEQRQQLREVGEQFAVQMRKVNDQVSAQVRRMGAPAKLWADHITSVTRSASQQLARIMEPVRLYQEHLGKAVSAALRATSEATRVWREYLDSQARFPVVMLELGWPVPLDAPAPLVARIVRGFDDLGDAPNAADLEAFSRTVDSWVLEFYDVESLQEKLDEWRSKRLLARRLPILEAAIGAHCRGEYVLSIPPLLAQAEGIIADGFNHHGRMGGRELGVYVQRLFGSGEKEQISAAINKAVVAFWTETLYAEFAHGEPISSPLSRHAVLHGGDVDYGTPEGSLKAILLVDLFQDSFSFAAVDRSIVYHHGDCVALGLTRGGVRFFKDEREAIAEGLRPCRRCLSSE